MTMRAHRPFAPRVLAWLWLLALIPGTGVGCQAQHPALSGATVAIRAVTDYDVPLSHVKVRIDKIEIGKTNAAGELRARLTGLEGTTFAIAASCPPGHSSASPLPSIVLGRYGPVGGKPDADFEVAVRCLRRQRALAVLVRAREFSRPPAGRRVPRHKVAIVVSPLSGLPVLFGGKPVAHTDASGLAHLTLDAPATGQLVLTFDTTSKPALRRLRPKSPSVSVEVKQDENAYLVDQAFAYDRPPPPPGKRHIIKILEGGMDGKMLDLPRW
jgi:hypothetical protein